MDDLLVLDSHALLAHFEDEPGAEEVERVLKGATKGKPYLLLSTVNWGEIYSATYKRRGLRKADEIVWIIDQLPIELVPVDRDLASQAARLKGEFPVAYGDCFAAGLALLRGCGVVTGDPEFEKLAERVKIYWIKGK